MASCKGRQYATYSLFLIVYVVEWGELNISESIRFAGTYSLARGEEIDSPKHYQ